MERPPRKGYWEQIDDERMRLLAMTENEALALGNDVWYQRMRFEREIEGAKFLEELRRKMPEPLAEKARNKKSKVIWTEKD
ncbi:hypothetical protein KW791_00175 [Candidatus Parcubacteria bacterium]|nr:hypothetical protein [Candidatus Parcubacteria bacterium]